MKPPKGTLISRKFTTGQTLPATMTAGKIAVHFLGGQLVDPSTVIAYYGRKS